MTRITVTWYAHPAFCLRRSFIFHVASWVYNFTPGFLQVTENWKKSRNLSRQGKVRGKYFFWKSQGKWKIGANRCQIFSLKCIKFYFRWGSTPDPTGGAYNAPPDPLAAVNIAP